MFARDSFVSLGRDVTGAFVVNQGDRGSSGSHWLSIFIQRSHDGMRTCIFFDSLGRGAPDQYNIAIPMTKKYQGSAAAAAADDEPLHVKLRVVYNTRRFQTETSQSCGLYCLYVLVATVNTVTYPSWRDAATSGESVTLSVV